MKHFKFDYKKFIDAVDYIHSKTIFVEGNNRFIYPLLYLCEQQNLVIRQEPICAATYDFDKLKSFKPFQGLNHLDATIEHLGEHELSTIDWIIGMVLKSNRLNESGIAYLIEKFTTCPYNKNIDINDPVYIVQCTDISGQVIGKIIDKIQSPNNIYNEEIINSQNNKRNKIILDSFKV